MLDINFNARLPRGARAFGGFNLERSINNTCVAALSDPNKSLYCDQSESGVDFSVSKRFEFGSFRLTPKMDLFNALNSDDYSSVATAQFGAAAYKQPSVILQGRIIRIGADVSW